MPAACGKISVLVLTHACSRLSVFESEFLSNPPESIESYARALSRAVETLTHSWPARPYSGRTAAELAPLIDSDFLPEHGCSPDGVSGILRSIIANSVAVTHPNTAAHLHCPPLIASLAAEVVISGLNQSMDSFDQAPIATILEQKLVRWICVEAGLPQSADGTFTTGGSQSNYMGLLLARDHFLGSRWNWSAQTSGLPPEAQKLRILCSEVAHFTVEKSAAQLGLGTKSVVRIPVDERFRMDPAAARATIEALKARGLDAMAIVATAGTTDFGSIDPLPELAALAREVGCWLHVDAAYGGALLFSREHRSRLAGIEAADSMSIDFHKLLWQPIPCSVFLLRDARHFDAIKMHADYLNPEAHEEENIPNLVTRSLLTSRRFDALKLWISFQSLGRVKLAAMIDRTIALAEYGATVLHRTPGFEVIAPPQLSTIVFRFAPEDSNADLDWLNARLRQKLFDQGTAVVGHSRIGNRQCLKFTCMNPAASEEQIEELIRVTAEEGKKLLFIEDKAIRDQKEP